MFDGVSTRRTDPLAPIGGVSRGMLRRDAIEQNTAGRWTNTSTGRGGDMDRHAHTGYVTPFAQPYPTIDAMLEFNAIAARIVNREPDDAIREGVDLDLGEDSDPEVKSAILDEVDRTMGLEDLADGRRWARAYGGGLIIAIVDDGRELDQPIDWQGIRVVHGFETVDRHEAYPVVHQGKITHYRLTNLSHAMIHASRVFPMLGTKLPRRVRELRLFWGGSVLDQVWDALRNYSDAVEGAAEALSLLTQGVFTSNTLAQAVDGGDIDIVAARLEALRIGMGLMGDIILDPQDETYEIKQRPVSGVGEVIDRLQEHLVAATDMPTSILFGKTPGGLNSGENAGEIRSWYDHVNAVRKRDYTPPMRWMFRLIMAQAVGPTNGEILKFKVVWPSLWQETDLTKAQTRLSKAQARALDKAAGVVSVEELRRDPSLPDEYDDFDPDAPPPPEPTPTASPLGAEDEDDEAEAGVTALVETPLSERPVGEVLMTGRQIAQMFGYKTGAPIKTMHSKGLIGGWRFFRGAPWRYALSQIEAAVKAAQ